MAVRSRAGSGGRRPRDGQGGRPGACRRGTAQIQQSDGRRITSHRRIDAGAQARERGRTGAGAARRRRSALRLLGNAADRGAWRRARRGHRRAHRDRQDRQGVADTGAGIKRDPTRNPASGAHLRGDRLGAMRARYRSLRHQSWRLAQWAARRDHSGDGKSAGGIPGCAHGIPGARRVANFATGRADPARAGNRDIGVHHRVMRGQDRHAYPKPHGRAAPLGAGGGRNRSAGSRGQVPARGHRI